MSVKMYVEDVCSHCQENQLEKVAIVEDCFI